MPISHSAATELAQLLNGASAGELIPELVRQAGPIRSHPDGCAVAGFLHPSSISSPLMSCANAAMPSVTDQIPFSRRLLIAMVRSMATI